MIRFDGASEVQQQLHQFIPVLFMLLNNGFQLVTQGFVVFGRAKRNPTSKATSIPVLFMCWLLGRITLSISGRPNGLRFNDLPASTHQLEFCEG
jgi:hypothetical protein